ncbi:hypothetical protein HAX54_031815 [Datura stramonium]|uniref:Uncharacterized protein n=1 Tax=Datura stramonium TaxID=4076 RepID=A0ABS8SC42_DATST|nr:hypothetical protein [Datura stramonium]
MLQKLFREWVHYSHEARKNCLPSPAWIKTIPKLSRKVLDHSYNRDYSGEVASFPRDVEFESSSPILEVVTIEEDEEIDDGELVV